MKLKVINKIPRVVFYYKSMRTNEQLEWRKFLFPSRPSTILGFVRNFLTYDKRVYKDKLGILLSHDDIYLEDDIILAVGVGSGISLTHNCAKPRSNNSFIGIDGSQEQIEIAKANCKLNGVDSSKFELIEGYVGNPTHVYGEKNQQSLMMIDINKIKFDVLELDCEGSEIEILRDISVRPRHIIVEMHPMYRYVNIEIFLEEMKSKGYKLMKIFTANGESINKNKLDIYFRRDFIEKMIENQLHWGDSVVVLNFSFKKS